MYRAIIPAWVESLHVRVTPVAGVAVRVPSGCHQASTSVVHGLANMALRMCCCKCTKNNFVKTKCFVDAIPVWHGEELLPGCTPLLNATGVPPSKMIWGLSKQAASQCRGPDIVNLWLRGHVKLGIPRFALSGKCFLVLGYGCIIHSRIHDTIPIKNDFSTNVHVMSICARDTCACMRMCT